jgi:hypothetical protein
LASATVSPSSLTFSSLAVETVSAAQTVTVTNNGSLNLNLSTVSASANFTEQDDCSGQAIPPQGSCTVQVAFDPTSTGSLSGTLSIAGNVVGGELTVTLTGTGTGSAALVLNPSSVTFPGTLIGATSAAQVVTVSNTGGQSITLSGEAVTGNFAIAANTCAASLAANTGCSLSIIFTPSAAGARTGALTVIDSAGTQTIQLTGTGQVACYRHPSAPLAHLRVCIDWLRQRRSAAYAHQQR